MSSAQIVSKRESLNGPEVEKIPKLNKAAFWDDLMPKNELDPIHTLNCFIPKSASSIAHFKHTPMNRFNPGEP